MLSVFLRRLAALTMAFALMFVAACDGDTGPAGPTGPQGTQGDPGTQGDQGPQGDQGAQGEPGEPGTDGNANVTIHIFGGHDFTSDAVVDVCLGEDIGQQEFVDSSWTVYLGIDGGALESVYAYVPGTAYGGEYLTVRAYDLNAAICPTPQPLIDIALVDGPGVAYDEIRIIQVLANDVVDHTIATASSVVPDMTDYDAVIEHYGGGVTAIRH